MSGETPFEFLGKTIGASVVGKHAWQVASLLYGGGFSGAVETQMAPKTDDVMVTRFLSFDDLRGIDGDSLVAYAQDLIGKGMILCMHYVPVLKTHISVGVAVAQTSAECKMVDRDAETMLARYHWLLVDLHMYSLNHQPRGADDIGLVASHLPNGCVWMSASEAQEKYPAIIPVIQSFRKEDGQHYVVVVDENSIMSMHKVTAMPIGSSSAQSLPDANVGARDAESLLASEVSADSQPLPEADAEVRSTEVGAGPTVA